MLRVSIVCRPQKRNGIPRSRFGLVSSVGRRSETASLAHASGQYGLSAAEAKRHPSLTLRVSMVRCGDGMGRARPRASRTVGGGFLLGYQLLDELIELGADRHL